MFCSVYTRLQHGVFRVYSKALLTYFTYLLLFLLSETADVQSTYHMYVENSRSGIMKRSGMDVHAISDVQTLPIYSVSTRRALFNMTPAFSCLSTMLSENIILLFSLCDVASLDYFKLISYVSSSSSRCVG